MINEANEPSSACRLRRIYKVETSTPPTKANNVIVAHRTGRVKWVVTGVITFLTGELR
jgi:hypothetical protein